MLSMAQAGLQNIPVSCCLSCLPDLGQMVSQICLQLFQKKGERVMRGGQVLPESPSPFQAAGIGKCVLRDSVRGQGGQEGEEQTVRLSPVRFVPVQIAWCRKTGEQL